MPSRQYAADELAKLFAAIAHRDRIRLIEEVRGDEKDVQTLAARLHLSQSRVSQHLAHLRAHEMVAGRRAGRRVFYRLQQPELAAWLLQGLRFLESRFHAAEKQRSAVEEARLLWSGAPSETKEGIEA